MASTQQPAVPEYSPPPPSKATGLDYIDLADIDLGKYKDEAARPALAKQLLEAASKCGFFTVSNYGLSPATVQRHMAFAQSICQVSEEERNPYVARPDDDAAGYNPLNPEDRSYHHYNIKAWEPNNIDHAPVVKPMLPEIKNVIAHLQNEVIQPLLHLLAIALEVDPEVFTKTHGAEASSSDYIRYMFTYPRDPEELKAHEANPYSGVHTDWGSLIFIISEPTVTTQILEPSTKKWRWVRQVPDTLTVNVGEIFEYLTGGLLKATLHNGVEPPQDQRPYKWADVAYLGRPYDALPLKPIQSPVLEKLGLAKALEGEPVRTVHEYIEARKKDLEKYDFGDRAYLYSS